MTPFPYCVQLIMAINACYLQVRVTLFAERPVVQVMNPYVVSVNRSTASTPEHSKIPTDPIRIAIDLVPTLDVPFARTEVLTVNRVTHAFAFPTCHCFASF